MRWVFKALMPDAICLIGHLFNLFEKLDYFRFIHLANGFFEALSIVEFITHLRPPTPVLSPREKLSFLQHDPSWLLSTA